MVPNPHVLHYPILFLTAHTFRRSTVRALASHPNQAALWYCFHVTQMRKRAMGWNHDAITVARGEPVVGKGRKRTGEDKQNVESDRVR